TVGAHPEKTAIIFKNAAYCVSSKAIPIGKYGERTCLAVEFVEPVLSPNPSCAGPVKVHGVYPVVAQTVQTIHIMLINAEFASRWVETLQTCELRAKPQNALLVFDPVQVKKVVALSIRPIRCKAPSRGV